MSEIIVRQAAAADEKFLRDVYFSTRGDEVSAFGWDAVQTNAFLEMQFCVRQQAYKMQYPTAEYSVVVFENEQAGSLIVERLADRICLTDIAVLPAFQRRGIATFLIQQLQSNAARSSVPLLLHVDKNNLSAMTLYHKLGFVVIAEGDLAYEMEWRMTRATDRPRSLRPT